jgi:ATP-dependent RNA circularization protein (DNA/RNA ligase family)
VTEKLDGCSATYVYNKKKFMVCSRNIEVVNKDSRYWKIAEKYNIKNILKGNKIAIQGEIIGHSQNGSGKNIYMSEIDFYIFNIINTITRRNYDLKTILNFCEQYNLKFVPLLDSEYILGTDNVDQLIEKAKGISKLYSVEREGIVIRDIENKYQPIRRVGDSLSFKIINPDFLIKHCNKEGG